MTKPMIHKGYEIKWNFETGVFEVRSVGGKEILFADAIGKKCYDWINEKEAENETDI